MKELKDKQQQQQELKRKPQVVSLELLAGIRLSEIIVLRHYVRGISWVQMFFPMMDLEPVCCGKKVDYCRHGGREPLEFWVLAERLTI